MEKATFSFAWVIALIALIAFSYISFMGLVYWQLFSVGVCALFTLILDFMIMLCMLIMCRARRSRWLRLGLLGQIMFGLVALVLLLASSVMFAHFTRIISQQEEIRSTYAAAIEDAQTLDENYDQYINERCVAYSAALSSLKPASKEYKALFSNTIALGFSKDEAISKCVVNLKKLLGGNKESENLKNKREQWLKTGTASVWNLSFPANIRDFSSSVNQWIDNYTGLSSKSYTGETNVAPFEDNTFNQKMNALNAICTTIGRPSLLAIVLAIVCFILILLPWIVTPKNMASIGDDFDVVVEMPEDGD
jgi:hypothetical protein